jgi:ketosteroid isomerase-like protein
MPADAEALTLQLLDAWNARDLARYVAMLAEDVEWYDPAMPQPPARGRAAVQAFSESVLRAFPDFKYEVLGPMCVSADGARCAVHWRITATHTAPLTPPGYAPTGRTMRQEGIDLLEVHGAQVTRILTCFDVIAAAEQVTGVTLRATSGSVLERMMVFGQRLVAAWSRRRSATSRKDRPALRRA